MKMMKRLLLALVLVALCCALAACQKSEPAATTQNTQAPAVSATAEPAGNPDDVMLTVGTYNLTRAQYENYLRTLQDYYGNYGYDVADPELQAMLKQFALQTGVEYAVMDQKLIEQASTLWEKVEKSMNGLQFSAALSEIWKLIGDCNKYIDLTTPWILAKNEEDRPRLGTVMYVLLECARIVGVLIAPTMPRTPERIFAQIGVTDDEFKIWESVKVFGGAKPGSMVKKGEALFPRIDIAKELELLEAERQAAIAAAQKAEIAAPADEEKTVFTQKDLCAFEDFEKIQLVVAKVLKCEKVPKADKLLKSTLKVGDTERIVVSGIAKFYTPEEMVGKKVVLLANLAPRKIRGVESHGMLLCAANADDSKLSLLTVDSDMEDGCEIG